MYFSFYLLSRNEYPEAFLRQYRAIGWGLPGLAVVYLVLRQLTGHIGVGGADRRWCWIAVHSTREEAGEDPFLWRREGALQQLVLFYVPVAGVLIFNVGIYHTILKDLHMDPLAPRFRAKVKLYLGTIVLCSIWGLMNRLVQYFRADHTPSAFLSVMESICDPLQPLLNAVWHATNKNSLKAYKDHFRACWTHTSVLSSDEEESSRMDDAPLLPQVVDAIADSSVDPLDREFGHYFQPRVSRGDQDRKQSVS